MAPTSRRIGFIVLALLVIPAVGAGIATDNDPSAGLRRYREDFDALVVGSVPCAGISNPTQCFYTVTTAGSGGTNAVATAPAGLTGKSWQIAAGAAAFGVQMANTNTGVNLCGGTQSITFMGVVPDLASGDVVEYRVIGAAVSTTQGPPESLFVRFTGQLGSTNDVNYGVRGVTGAATLSATGTHSAGDDFTMTIAQVNCTNLASAVFTDADIGGLGPSVTVGPAASAITTTLNRLSAVHTTSAGSATFWLDDYDWQGAPIPSQPTPFITELDPESGVVEGGTEVDIIGGNFQNGAIVTFDNTPSVGAATFINSGLMRATSPPHAAGEVELELTNPDGQTATATYTYAFLGGGGAEFSSPSTIGTIANSGRNVDMDIAPDGFLGICHVAGSGSTVVWDISSDGENFETSVSGTTNNIRTCGVIDENRFGYVTSDNENTGAGIEVRYTENGGDAWASSTVIPSVGGTGSGRHGFDGGSGIYVVAAPYCSPCNTGSNQNFRSWKSTTFGATWVEVGSPATLNGGFSVWSSFTNIDIDIVSASEWWIYFHYTGGTFDRIGISHTVDGGTTYSTEIAQDLLDPISVYGAGVRGTPDGNYVSFYDDGILTEGFRASATTWRFSQIDSTQLSSSAGIALCGNQAAIVYQPATNEGKVVFTAVDGVNAPVSTVIVGGANDATTQNPRIVSVGSTMYIAYRDSGTQLLTFITLINCSAEAGDAPGPADIVIAPDQLKGFDVTPSGSALITREGTIGTDTGRNVVLYNGNNLAAGPTQDTDCNFDQGIAGASIINSIDGVNAGNDLVSYYECDASDGDTIDEIAIRVASSTFATPEFPETCAGACYADIPDEELAGDDNSRRELSDLAEYPFDFSRHFSQGSNHVFLTWGFSTVQGDVGVVALSQINGRADESRADSKVIDATGTLQIKICTTRISNQDFDLIYGVGSAANGDVKGFKVDYATSGENVIDTDIILTPSLDVVVFAGGQINGPYGIGCAENLLLTQQSGGGATVDLWNVATNTHRVVATNTVGLSHSQALNPVASIGAFVDGTTIKVFRTDTLAVFQNLTLPAYTGIPCGMFITGTGTNQALWWGACGATGTIAKYELTTPFDNQTFNPGADTDGDGIPNINDPDIDGDEIPNESDPDIDGDGIPNETDTDDDGDGLLDANDPSPGGTATGPGAVDPDADGGQGLFGVSRRNAIIFSGVMVLAALLIGFAVTTTKRRRQVNRD